MKRRTIQVRIFRGEAKYVAECMDLAVVTEGDTLDEVVANIREAVGLHIEGEDLNELGLSDDPAIVASMELEAPESRPAPFRQGGVNRTISLNPALTGRGW